MKPLLRTYTALVLTATIGCASAVSAQDQLSPGVTQSIPQMPYLLQTRPGNPIKFEKKQPGFEEMIHREDVSNPMLQPVPLQGMKIPGLSPKALEMLGFNYFIVVENSNTDKMSDIYREARLAGKSLYVTADSVIHPYNAFQNRVLADVIEKHISNDLYNFLVAVQKTCLDDYTQADDAEVRDDIERNVAYIAVAAKLLNKDHAVPSIGRVQDFVNLDIKSLESGAMAFSSIFERQSDFSPFRPVGWYQATPTLANFYKARAWLSLMAFPVDDITVGDQGNQTNAFRRSVMLSRAMDLTTINGKPANDEWTRLIKAFNLLAPTQDLWSERTLLPSDYKLVFANHSRDLKVTLSALSEPLYRTKLMLAIRRQKPVNLGAASIFDIDGENKGGQAQANFRFFPVTGEAEGDWLRVASRYYPPDKHVAALLPVALLNLYVRGGGQAGNILSDNFVLLDQRIIHLLPTLQRSVLVRTQGGPPQQSPSRRWGILSAYFQRYPDTVPPVLRTDLWSTRKLASAISGWVDSQIALAPPLVPPAATQKPSQPIGQQDTSIAAQAARKIQKVTPFHYLEPASEIYKNIALDAQKTIDSLTALSYFDEAYRPRLMDFLRLAQRLQKIAENELRGVPMTPLDSRLLGSFDQVLERVDVPVTSVLNLEPMRTHLQGDPDYPGGINWALGKPATAYVLMQNPRTLEWTLARGAMFTFYEVSAPLMTESEWKKKLASGTVLPPTWLKKFEIIQPPLPASKQAQSSLGTK